MGGNRGFDNIRLPLHHSTTQFERWVPAQPQGVAIFIGLANLLADPRHVYLAEVIRSEQ